MSNQKSIKNHDPYVQVRTEDPQYERMSFPDRLREVHELCLEMADSLDVLHDNLELMKDVFIKLSFGTFTKDDHRPS